MARPVLTMETSDLSWTRLLRYALGGRRASLPVEVTPGAACSSIKKMYRQGGIFWKNQHCILGRKFFLFKHMTRDNCKMFTSVNRWQIPGIFLELPLMETLTARQKYPRYTPGKHCLGKLKTPTQVSGLRTELVLAVLTVLLSGFQNMWNGYLIRYNKINKEDQKNNFIFQKQINQSNKTFYFHNKSAFVLIFKIWLFFLLCQHMSIFLFHLSNFYLLLKVNLSI